MFKNAKSIKTSILAMILPIFIVAVLVVSVVGYKISKDITQTSIQEQMESDRGELTQRIQSGLKKHAQIAIDLARIVESTSSVLQKEQYINLLTSLPQTNSDTMGTGVWFEPYAYQKDMQLFGPYAYKEDSKIVYTDEYYAPGKTYLNDEWYLNGKNTDKLIVWSSPYYDDVAKVTMVTASAPFYGENKILKGIATADISLKNVQKMIKELKLSEDENVFLLAKDGTYIAGTNISDEKIMKEKISSDEKFKAVASTIISGKDGTVSYTDINGENRLYFSAVPETGWIIAISISEKALFAPIVKMRNIQIGCGVISLIFVFLAITLFSRSIAKRLNKVKNVAQAVANCDLTQKVVDDYKDEIGQIGIAVNTMTVTLGGILKKIQETSSDVTSTAEEQEASAAQNGQAAEQVATSVAEISTLNENVLKISIELEKMINYFSELSTKINQDMNIVDGSLNGVNTLSNDGSNMIKILIVIMNQSVEAITLLANAMEKLSNNSNKIDEIVLTIRGIAAQTNLLALNASIEAARAGEAGRGFAVVADEIRKLAEQSSDSAQSIGKLISEVKTETNTTLASTESVVKTVNDGQKAVMEVGKCFNEIVENIGTVTRQAQNTGELAKNINTSSVNLKKSVEDLVKTTKESSEETSSIAAATEEQLASAQEQSATAAGLAHMSEELQREINKFKI